MSNKFIKTGKCIFCGKEVPEVSFNHRPHVIPQKMGGKIIGYDVCDDCNHYFGTTDTLIETPIGCSIEECVKEIFNLSRFLFDLMNHENPSILSSRFFDYFQSKNVIKIRRSFRTNTLWKRAYARQFKRGLYELFLQSYHVQEGCDANDSRFDEIRQFARYNIGNIPAYYVVNKGAYLMPKDMSHPKFFFPQKQLETINEFGFYSLYLDGHIFYLEVTPKGHLCKDYYLNMKAEKICAGGFCVDSIIPLERIDQMDFTYRNLRG